MAFAIALASAFDARWTTAEKRTAIASKEECERLCIPLGHTVVRSVRVRRAQGRNDLVCSTLIPVGTPARLVASGIACERLSIVPAPEWVADLLDVAANTPMLKLDRIVRTASGLPVEWRLTYSLASDPPGAPSIRRKLRAQNR